MHWYCCAKIVSGKTDYTRNHGIHKYFRASPPAYLQDNINVMPVTHYANCKTWLNPTLTRAMIRSDTRSDWLIQIWEPLLVILDFFAKKWDFLHTCNIYFHSESLMAAV